MTPVQQQQQSAVETGLGTAAATAPHPPPPPGFVPHAAAAVPQERFVHLYVQYRKLPNWNIGPKMEHPKNFSKMSLF